ncbi:adenylate kinase 9-like, partial [Neodiprion virginianus]|uniref:adenylate kinase 9-like n=1 Tax=Neodiprion virginianus TaxID=2961670 RepID=UPI001EE76A84
MCDTELERLKLCAKPSTREGEKFAVSTSVITKRKYLEHVKGYPPRVKSSPSWPPPNPRIFPKANMYYAFNEDTNPFTRVSGFMETVCNCLGRGEVQPHFPPPLDPFSDRDPYSEEEARCKQLLTEPVCFAIFGKPRLNSTKLAKMIAKFWNCVLISPECLLREEIEANTDKGRWIKQVLRVGRSVGPEVVMNLVESRLKERDIMHRGYVVEGLPLIPNDPDLDYAAYPNPSSVQIPFTPTKQASFVSAKVDSEKSEVDDSLGSELEEEISEIAEEELPENEEDLTSDSSRSYDLARNPFATESLRMILRDDYQWDIGNQIRDIFSTWPLKPGVVIYVVCPDPDVIQRRGQFRVDPYSGDTIDTGLWEARENWKGPSSGSDDEEMIELEREIASEQALIHEDLKKHLVTRLSDMRSNVEVQCRIFEQYALPCIERFVLAHNPQHVIRVDGRTSASRMFQVVRVRLRTLQLPRVILPKKMFDVDERDSVVGGEETPQSSNDNEFEGKDKQEVFQQLRYKGVVASRFRWTLSKWKFTCPVALSKGRRIEGSPANAVRFMNKMYFMSSPEAARTFVENPRPFLLPPNPKPVCKIFVYGQKQSGKTSLSEFLAQIYGGKLLDPQAIENREMDHRRNSLIRKAVDEICGEVIDEVNENLENERDEREVARIAALRGWCTEAQLVAGRLLQLLKNKSAKEDYEHEKDLAEMRDEIAKYNLTSLLTDFELCQRVVGDKNILMDFAPTALIYMEPPIRELDEYDPEVAAILVERTEKVRQEKVELAVEDVGKLIAANINAAQTAPNFLGLAESGWVVDGMNANVELLEKVLEKGVEVEEIIVLHEAQPYEYLIKKWRQNYRDEIAKQRLTEAESELGEEGDQERKSEISGDVDKLDDTEGDFEGQPSESSITVNSEDRELTEYIDALKQFDSIWEIMREKLLEKGLRIIDVKLSATINVESYVKQEIDDHYRFEATVMTDEEKDREAEEANLVEVSSDVEELAEEEEEIAEKPSEQKDNRRLGDTGVFCPVALRKHNVLWKGKDEFSAMFMDKIYLLSSQAALNEFVNQPRDFVPCRRPMEPVPLPRVSIVGPLGSGKSTLSN